ncbi:MAG: FGGY family carbohydrate kinase [Candidatus Nanopelagicaceae bacterium]|nr:FGGY family carbohydrate kinase [Candidatus Nanopelagicaceae bacterium]
MSLLDEGTLVAGVDSSTQSVKVVIRRVGTGELVRSGRADHPSGTEVDPNAWWLALQDAIEATGGLGDVAGISVGGQQHGMVALDESGEVIRPALLWNDTRSAQAATDLNDEYEELNGGKTIASAVGSRLVASFTVSKVRWLADNEPENAKKVAALALPHDWLSWKLSGSHDINDLFTDRSDASGTGYFDSVTSTYRRDILAQALRDDREIVLPRILAPLEIGARTSTGVAIGPGCGDNAGAALGVGASSGDVIVSLGTSGTAFSVSRTPTHDAQGFVAGFADATGNYLPLVCTLNAARILDAGARILGVSHAEFGERALAAKPGAEGLTLLPYFEGERTPDRPNATGALTGLNLSNSTPENIARAMIEGMLCGLVGAVTHLKNDGVEVKRILIIGGAAKNPAIAPIASALFGKPVHLPSIGEYVADGASKQMAWALQGSMHDWNPIPTETVEAVPSPFVMDRYLTLVQQTQLW